VTDAARVRQRGLRRHAAGALAADGVRWRRLTVAAVGGGLFLRLVIAARAPLLPDEAYYWQWSRHLASGYFDHPPGVAWLIRAGTAVAGATPLGVRLGALVTGTGAVACVVAIARRLGGDLAGLRAAVLLLCIPLVTIGLAIATTDAPALFAIAAALLAIVRAVEAPPASRASASWWVVAGIAFGFGLLSKLTVGIVGAAAGLALLARPGLRAQLRTMGPWLAVVCAVVMATPFLYWNQQHDWISFRFQLTHGLGAPSHGSVAGRELALVAGQLGLVSPLIFLLAVASGWRALRMNAAGGARDRDAAFMLAAVGFLVLAFFAYSAMKRPVEANWPAPALVALVPLVAAPSGLTMRRWWWPAIAVGGAMVVVALVQLATPLLPLAPGRDPVARAYGWSTLADAADSVRRAGNSAGSPPVATWLSADRYQDAAEIGFLAPRHPTVFALNLGGRPNQYDLWPSFADSAHHGDGLVVAVDTGAAEAHVIEVLSPHFESVAPARHVTLARAGRTIAVRRLWRFSGWRGSWPARSPGGH